MTPKRTALRWHGGKWLLAPWITSHFPKHRIYVEPFGGGGSVLIRKQRVYSEIYNDLDNSVVNLFRILRDPAKAAKLAKLIHLTPFSRTEFFKAYERSKDKIEDARRLLVRSHMGFGSDSHNPTRVNGFRQTKDGRGSVPSAEWRNYPDSLLDVTERFRGVTIENKDAVELIELYDGPNTLFYVDPPYVHSTRVNLKKNRGYTHEMSDRCHRKLAKALKAAKGMVIISGYRSPLYERLYRDWRVSEKEAFADTGGSRQRTEILWMNKAVPEIQGQLFQNNLIQRCPKSKARGGG